MTPKEAIDIVLDNSIVFNAEGGKTDEAIRMLQDAELVDISRTKVIPVEEIERFINAAAKEARDRSTTFYNGVLFAMTKLHVWSAHYPEIDASEIMGQDLPEEYSTKWRSFKKFVKSELAAATGYKHAVLAELLRDWEERNNDS